MKHIFSQDHATGVAGEKLFESVLKNNNKNYRPATLSEQQKEDIDFVVVGKGEEIKIEVKNDQKIHETGNMFYEDISNLNKVQSVKYFNDKDFVVTLPNGQQITERIDEIDGIGCMERTTSKFIVYISSALGKYIIVPTDKLRTYVHTNFNRFYRHNKVDGSNSSGLLVPMFKTVYTGRTKFNGKPETRAILEMNDNIKRYLPEAKILSL